MKSVARMYGISPCTVRKWAYAFRGPCPQVCWSRNLRPAFTDNSPRYQPYVLKAPLYPKPRGKKTSPAANFPHEFKIALVEQSLQPGTCVAQIARENEINDNLLFNWCHQYRKGSLLPSSKNMPALLPVALTQPLVQK